MVEVIKETVEKFKSKNGNTYDTFEKAEHADKEWDRKHSFDPAKAVASYEAECNRNFARKQKRIDEDRDYFPNFWKIERKYGTDYYMCGSFEDMEKMGWSVFCDTLDYYLCGDEEAVAVARLIKETGNKKAALEFAHERSSRGYEYETFEDIYMCTFGDKT